MLKQVDIRAFIATLAKGQGGYARLLQEFDTNEFARANITKLANKAGVKDMLDFVIFVEQ